MAKEYRKVYKEEMKMNKITFGDLNTPLKILVVVGWIMVGIYTLLFLFGFMIGILGGI